MSDTDAMKMLFEVWLRVSDTQRESSRPVLMQILKPYEKRFQQMKEERNRE